MTQVFTDGEFRNFIYRATRIYGNNPNDYRINESIYYNNSNDTRRIRDGRQREEWEKYNTNFREYFMNFMITEEEYQDLLQKIADYEKYKSELTEEEYQDLLQKNADYRQYKTILYDIVHKSEHTKKLEDYFEEIIGLFTYKGLTRPQYTTFIDTIKHSIEYATDELFNYYYQAIDRADLWSSFSNIEDFISTYFTEYAIITSEQKESLRRKITIDNNTQIYYRMPEILNTQNLYEQIEKITESESKCDSIFPETESINNIFSILVAKIIADCKVTETTRKVCQINLSQLKTKYGRGDYIHISCKEGDELMKLYEYCKSVGIYDLINKRLYIHYLKEDGTESESVDVGGLTRNFLTNILDQIKNLLFTRNEKSRLLLIPKINELLKEEEYKNLYILAGSICCYSILQEIPIPIDITYLLIFRLLNKNVELAYILYLDDPENFKSYIFNIVTLDDSGLMDIYLEDQEHMSQDLKNVILQKVNDQISNFYINSNMYIDSFIAGWFFEPDEIEFSSLEKIFSQSDITKYELDNIISRLRGENYYTYVDSEKYTKFKTFLTDIINNNNNLFPNEKDHKDFIHKLLFFWTGSRGYMSSIGYYYFSPVDYHENGNIKLPIGHTCTFTLEIDHRINSVVELLEKLKIAVENTRMELLGGSKKKIYESDSVVIYKIIKGLY